MKKVSSHCFLSPRSTNHFLRTGEVYIQQHNLTTIPILGVLSGLCLCNVTAQNAASKKVEQSSKLNRGISLGNALGGNGRKSGKEENII
ncbi:hypothetical protein ACTXT7_004727 [Hymenolepis weldensis]